MLMVSEDSLSDTSENVMIAALTDETVEKKGKHYDYIL